MTIDLVNSSISFKATKLLGLSLLAMLCLTGCHSKPKPLPEKSFGVAYKKFAPEPVYNRMRYAHLPEVIPNGGSYSASQGISVEAPMLMPVASLELNDATLEEASKALAQFSDYRSYCSSLIADRKISIARVGTLDELAQAISNLAHIKVVVDHNNRSISFLGSKVLSDRLSEDTVDDEHRSHY